MSWRFLCSLLLCPAFLACSGPKVGEEEVLALGDEPPTQTESLSDEYLVIRLCRHGVGLTGDQRSDQILAVVIGVVGVCSLADKELGALVAAIVCCHAKAGVVAPAQRHVDDADHCHWASLGDGLERSEVVSRDEVVHNVHPHDLGITGNVRDNRS